MKTIKRTIAVCLVGALLTSCFGSFKLTTSLWEWNSQVGDKFVNELIFLAFVIIPVYPVASFVDAVVLNTIEFWSGDNPMSMKEGEKDQQIVEIDGKQYRMTAERHKMTIEDLEDANAKTELIYREDDQSWYVKKGDEWQKLVELEMKDGKIISYNYYQPNGQVQHLEPGFNPLAVQQELQSEMTLALQP